MTHIKDYTGRRAHLIGIGGSSMSGLAGMLVKLGVRVTGSDSACSLYDRRARAIGHSCLHRPARGERGRRGYRRLFRRHRQETTPERMRAEELGIPQMERATLLGQLMEGYRHAVNICGTHGKTTTTSMIAEAMLDTGFDLDRSHRRPARLHRRQHPRRRARYLCRGGLRVQRELPPVPPNHRRHHQHRGGSPRFL